MRRIRRHGGTRRRRAVLCAVLAAAALLLAAADLRLRPVVGRMAAYQANLAAVSLINDAVAQTLAMEDVDYADVVTIERGDDHSVSALHTDTAAVNRIMTRATETIRQTLENEETACVRVPVGTLTANSFLIGRGPEIEIELQLAGTVLTRIDNQFQETGLNQTCHRILLEVTADLSVILPGNRTQTSVQTNYCIAETVIVGKVPEAYTYVGERGDAADVVADYGAG